MRYGAGVAVNLRSVFLMCRAAIPLLRRAGAEHGRALVVNVGSIFGRHGQAGVAAYSASKGGLVAFTQALHGELVADGVRASVVSPGYVDTGLTWWVPGDRDDLIQPTDVAEAVRFLLRTSPACVVPEIQMVRTSDRVVFHPQLTDL